MTITTAGFDGALAEGDFAKIIGDAGTPYGPPCTLANLPDASSMRVSVNSGAVLTVTVSAGQILGWGVLVKSDAAIDKTLASVTSGTRWDLVCLRRDWSTNTASIEVVQGTATQAIPSGRSATPGGVDDQPLALVQVTAGQTVPTAVLDLRVFPSKVLEASSLLGVPTRLGTIVRVAGINYRRELVGTTPTWVSFEQPPVLASPSLSWRSGWVNSGTQLKVKPGRLVAYLRFKRNGATITASATGGLADTQVVTLPAPFGATWQSPHIPALGLVNTVGTSGNAGFGAILGTSRVVALTHLTNPNVALTNGSEFFVTFTIEL